MNDPIFADFEGNKKGELFLLSVRFGGLTTTYILDERLRPLAESELAEDFNLVVIDAKGAINSLAKLWGNGAQPFAAYSQAEKSILKEGFGFEVPSYLDIRKLAKKWINRNYKREFERLPTYKPKSKNWQDKRGTWSLEAIAKWLDLGLPKQYGRGKTTSRINAIIDGFKAKGADYSKLTSLKKKKARNLLEHNVFDVEGLERLFSRISKEDTQLVSRVLE